MGNAQALEQKCGPPWDDGREKGRGWSGGLEMRWNYGSVAARNEAGDDAK